MDVLDKGILGRPVAHIWVVEFQKRGLPHAHILLIVNKEDVPRSADDYDQFVRAEIPDKVNEAKLYECILAHNLHGPYGSLNPKSPCMKDGKCSKVYPKTFVERTQHSEDGYPL